MRMKAFFESQFSHCPLVWMCHSRTINTRINNLHQRVTSMVYKDDTASFEELLRKDGSVTIHQRNLQFLVTEMFKVKTGIAPPLVKGIFNSNHNLETENVSAKTRARFSFYNPANPKKVNTGLQSIRCLAPKFRLWYLIR